MLVFLHNLGMYVACSRYFSFSTTEYPKKAVHRSSDGYNPLKRITLTIDYSKNFTTK